MKQSVPARRARLLMLTVAALALFGCSQKAPPPEPYQPAARGDRRAILDELTLSELETVCRQLQSCPVQCWRWCERAPIEHPKYRCVGADCTKDGFCRPPAWVWARCEWVAP